jgi:gamma-butyrobetaine dioxygenase/trimethyllysine dioxygenase
MSETVVVEAGPDFLRLRWGDETADFHYFWLRHNCDCCRHPLTRERTLCSSSVPLDLRPVGVRGDGTGLHILWPDEGDTHASHYPYAWLRQHAYGRESDAVEPPSSDLAPLEIRALPEGRPLHAACIDVVRRHGAAIVRGAGLDTEALIDDFRRGGYRLIETHFGRIEDLRTDNSTNRNTDQLGYTDAAVDLHSDQPFLEEPPHYQMLHCMRPADRGGDNALADALQAALYLRSLDASAYELLTTVPVRFVRQQREFAKEFVTPIIELRAGRPVRVRSSYFTMAPHRVPFERMEDWYRAYNRFARLVADPRHQIRVALAAGDLLLYDNHRMLHARTSFEGPRWMRGIYFDREENDQ